MAVSVAVTAYIEQGNTPPFRFPLLPKKRLSSFSCSMNFHEHVRPSSVRFRNHLNRPHDLVLLNPVYALLFPVFTPLYVSADAQFESDDFDA